MPNLRSIQCWLQAVWIWKLTFTRSYFSDVPASLVHDVFHYYLFQAIGGFISCRLMQHAASKFSRLLFIQNSRVLDDMPSCHVLSQQTCWKKEVGWSGEKWASFHLCHPHQASVSAQLFEASLIPALRIKPMKKKDKKWQSDRRRHLRREQALLKYVKKFVCTDPQCNIWGKFVWHIFLSDQGLAIGFAWIGKAPFEVAVVSDSGVFWNLNECPEMIVLEFVVWESFIGS